MPKLPKKLIEVALPLDDINKAAAREKSIRHGHPSTLHLWWARRPLAAARAVLFAQLVNDPGSTYEGDKRTKAAKAAIHAERERLFVIIRDLVQWENSTNEEVLEKARAEIRRSWAYTCRITGEDPERMPPVLDPFCGGGTIPLEAQRLGLEAHGSDLNPVPVLITKALVEIPPKFAGRTPVGPLIEREDRRGGHTVERTWKGAEGLAEDVRRYGQWMRDEAWKRIGHLYPQVDLPEEHGGGKATVIAWIWARTVKCPNPACGCQMPLMRSFWLSTKQGKETWLRPDIMTTDGASVVSFTVQTSAPPADKRLFVDAGCGYINEKGKAVKAAFRCLACETMVKGAAIDKQAEKEKLGEQLVAIVAEGHRQRVYLSVTPESVDILADLKRWTSDEEWNASLPKQKGRGTFASNAQGRYYGFFTYKDYFSPRQLVALTTFSDLVGEARKRVIADAKAASWDDDATPLNDGGSGATAYGDAVATYLAFSVSKLAETNSTLCTWSSAPKNELVVSTFRRQALPMTWDFAESNPFGSSSGNLNGITTQVTKVIDWLPVVSIGSIFPDNASTRSYRDMVISTDPPYYDNIGYADLSDFFYVWLRRSIKTYYPRLFTTMLVPKSEELIAAPYRQGSADGAHSFFMDGMTRVFSNMANECCSTIPTAIYYAFKQGETKEGGTSSSGWESFLQAVISSGYQITATWPLRTERQARSISIGTNALASSIVLACRPRPKNADEITRRQFQRELNQQLPDDLEEMIHGTEGVSPIAPVDLAQAAIGPGMAIFSQYRAVLEADGSPMSVHNALIMINKAIDEYFDAAEGSMDGLTRFCAQWVQQYGFKTGPYGEADGISRACGVSADGHPEAIESGTGKVRLHPAKEYDLEASPEMGKTSIWICLHSIAARLEKDGAASAGAYLAANPGAGPDIRSLAYRLYTICERAKLTDHARTYNNVVTSWDAICEASREAGHAGEQQDLFGGR